MTDANNNVVYETNIDVDSITPNQTYVVNMEHTVTIPKGVVCCLRFTCSSPNSPYAVIPTLNTTNRTDPNTYMSTLKMQTRKKSLNISYTYSYRQIYPLIILILEFVIIFIICFEHVTDYAAIYRKKRLKQLKRMEKEKNSIKHSHKKKFSIRNFAIYCLSEPKVEKNIRIAITVLNPLVLFIILETMNDTISGMYPNIWIFTWILLLAVQFILFAIFGNISIAMLIMDIILFPIGLGNLFILNVRGTPLLPSDIFGLATATEVASTYTLKFTPAEFIMIPAFIIWIMLIIRFKKKTVKTGMYKKVIRRCTPVIASVLILFVLYSTDLLEICGIKDSVWNKVASCKTNGFYMNFFINLRYLKVSEPAGYSHDKVSDILDSIKDTPTQEEETEPVQSQVMMTNSDFKTCTTLNGKKPNIILIMNESLADFSLVGSVNYNRDPLEYIHSMKENTIKGLDYVSVFGAGTSNSEFEAMTGNTMSFFPSGCNVYQQFMHESTYSLSSYLKSLGYTCNAIHPSSGANWNRTNTYKSMKFDKFITIDDFENPEYVRYISDKESYKKIIELYENRDKSFPMFVFDMTIQNHGGYQTNTNWDEPVYVKDSYYNEAKEFLSTSRYLMMRLSILLNILKKKKSQLLYLCLETTGHR